MNISFSHLKLFYVFALLSIAISSSQTPAGYDLWLEYSEIREPTILSEYQKVTNSIFFSGGNSILLNAEKELVKGLDAMLGQASDIQDSPNLSNTMWVVKKDGLNQELQSALKGYFEQIGKEGFIIKSVSVDGKNILLISANADTGILYGVFKFLQLMKMQKSLDEINLIEAPKIDLRMLNHWDNLDRTIERGYAGFSLWNWQKLPKYIDQRYKDYARANASIGINATVLTNVNANALVLTSAYLEKVAALADVFRPYGIKVYLTARFSAPIEIGGLNTADPLDKDVIKWWNNKVTEVYKYIPDFGGFLVKANSEGQPGPQNYGRTHVDGANMLATALKPFDGLVIWRAFVYSETDATDRAKQAFTEFVPYDGNFLDNVLVQVKNGPIDFQPREPFHPMFGAMPNTPLVMEFQITQEYLGFSSHLVFLPKLYEEVLDAETYRKGKNSTVAKVIDGSLFNKKISGMAGVANIGTDMNWTGHPFAQANWYGYGRLAWDPYLSSETIAEEWLRLTYSNNSEFVKPVKRIMIASREAVVNYMTPMGLHHLMDTGHHYGPGPWVGDLSRPEWNPTYYHNADKNGIGFDRTPTGSNATSQYAPEIAKIFNDPETCPEEYLLWFHHLPWDYELKNGRILWDALALKYQKGVDQVEEMISTWKQVKTYISDDQYNEVRMLLEIQLQEAKWWRNASLLYFQTFSGRELPDGVGRPEENLEYYKSLKFPYAPGN
ncbi:alpha-glucuronidase family glycosyl hydrolase [uncultured Eudoraea sp.]|uniref:alpha-glucuronidase family glycosyl hydrolase n=1 Tax=uncultured Eudoraea sp. TaxID=1035614 RepID=UPI0026018788|nr:alpha-glucuronidase family glycosyl hydrolase [uncultured Eudoraea sp.]